MPPNADKPASDDVGEGHDPPAEPTRGAAYAVLKALVGNRMPSGDLGHETISPRVLAVPIRWTTQAFIEHNRTCKRASCPSVPPSLWRYQRWRPEAIAEIGDKIHKVLWDRVDYELTDRVRKKVLGRHPELAKALSRGDLLTGDKLDEVLKELGIEGPQTLAGLLWALRFDVPHGEALFRILVPLADDSVTTSEEVEPPPQHTKRKSVERQLRGVTRQKKLAEQANQKALHEVAVREKALNKAKLEAEELRRNYRATLGELDTLRLRLRDQDTAHQIVERAAERAVKSNAALRNDLREARESSKELEVKRSELAQQLAFEKRYAEQVKLQHQAGAADVWQFLQNEQERIRVEQTITSGGARLRADRDWTNHRRLREAFLEGFPEYVPTAPPKLLPKAPLRFTALGGSGEVGRSCYLLELGTRRILIDCGIKPGVSEDLHPAIDHLERIDALLLTHAHTDHIGWVPALVQKFGDFDIYCSAATAALLPVMLDDCRRHYVRKIATARRNVSYSRNPEPVPEEYGDHDVRHVPNLAITCQFGEEVGLPGGVSIRFYRAGHILGAASILVEDQSGRRVFFSGDFSSFPQLTVPAAEWPDDLGEVDLLVLESTYGGRPPHALDESRRKLISIIREAAERGGSVILASFALGRAQELLGLIAAARKSGDLPTSVPVHVDGMINKINPVYQRLAGNLDVQKEGFFEVGGEAERRDVLFEAQTKPTIIVTTSGMMTGGPVIEYARQLLPDERHRIVFSGYQDEGAPSKALLALEHSGVVELTDETGASITFEAAVPARHVGLSAHADQVGLIEYAGRLSPKVIALVHGDAQGQEKLGVLLAGKHNKSQIVCAPSEFSVP